MLPRPIAAPKRAFPKLSIFRIMSVIHACPPTGTFTSKGAFGRLLRKPLGYYAVIVEEK